MDDTEGERLMNRVRGNILVLCHEGDRVSAVWGTVQKERVRIKGWRVARQPDDVSGADSAAMGAWIASMLRDAGCSARRCVVAVPRANVVLKRLALPVAAQGDDDLAGMVQLQMARQLTMPLHGAAIDYVRLGLVDPGDGGSVEVLAAALPGDYVSSARGMAKNAGLRLRSVALRGEGSATLFAELSYTQDGPVLGVSVTPQGVELGIVAEGRVVFSRAVEIPPPAEVEGWSSFTQRVAVEAKRTRVAYRGTGETADLVCVGLLGDDALAEAVGKTLRDELGLPWHTVRFPNTVELPSDMDSPTRAALAPLIGLMLGASIDRSTYDFSNPRKPPDPAAAIRQLALAGVFGLVVVGGGAWVIADQHRSALETQIRQADELNTSLGLQYIRQLRAEARVNHLEKLREERTDWLGHLQYLSQTLPPADRLRLEALTGSGSASVRFVTQGREGAWSDATTLSDGRWMMGRQVSLTLAGNASRDVADEVRADLVADNVYELSTKTADVAGKFEYVLTTTKPSPWPSVRERGREERVGPDAQPGAEGEDAAAPENGAEEGGAS